jgi:hypothetical protein
VCVCVCVCACVCVSKVEIGRIESHLAHRMVWHPDAHRFPSFRASSLKV